MIIRNVPCHANFNTGGRWSRRIVALFRACIPLAIQSITLPLISRPTIYDQPIKLRIRFDPIHSRFRFTLSKLWLRLWKFPRIINKNVYGIQTRFEKKTGILRLHVRKNGRITCSPDRLHGKSMKSFHFSCFALVDVEVLSNDAFCAVYTFHFGRGDFPHSSSSGDDIVRVIASNERIDRKKKKERGKEVVLRYYKTYLFYTEYCEIRHCVFDRYISRLDTSLHFQRLYYAYNRE